MSANVSRLHILVLAFWPPVAVERPRTNLYKFLACNYFISRFRNYGRVNVHMFVCCDALHSCCAVWRVHTCLRACGCPVNVQIHTLVRCSLHGSLSLEFVRVRLHLAFSQNHRHQKQSAHFCLRPRHRSPIALTWHEHVSVQ